ncbi:hypothetical protein D7S86_26035 [Pararobbsia silviterrae]|uniref:Uncharacterized protein n=1 Tax=Pararobbsia silviterrae TaxID=1792498 RepID=A0A494X3N5_9BURK|nr:hypothetical protein D7S86_26035 [Pararobbsia silviterrae]
MKRKRPTHRSSRKPRACDAAHAAEHGAPYPAKARPRGRGAVARDVFDSHREPETAPGRFIFDGSSGSRFQTDASTQ